MKTHQLKFAVYILSGMVCLGAYTAQAGNKAKPSKKTHNAVRPAKKSLAKMKVNNIEFGTNQYEVPSKSFDNLDKVAKLIMDNKAALNVGGYADNKGGYVFNWKLSEKRAKAVKEYLVSKGADSTRVAATEYGYTHPIASNKTAAGRQKNRRVELHFTE